MGPWRQTDTGGEAGQCPQMGYFLDPVIKCFRCSGCRLVVIRMGHEHLSPCPLWKFSPCTFYPQISLSPFFYKSLTSHKILNYCHDQSKSVL